MGDGAEKENEVHSEEELTCLLAAAQQGQREARERIFFLLHTRFLALAKLRVRGQDAEDIVQETLMVVERHLSEIGTVEALLAFTNQVMRNKIGNFYRREERRKSYHVTREGAVNPVYRMDEELNAADLERILRKAIDQVGERSPRCRAILLGLLEGLSVDEVCQQVGIKRTRIDDWIHRCRKELRRILSEVYRLRV